MFMTNLREHFCFRFDYTSKNKALNGFKGNQLIVFENRASSISTDQDRNFIFHMDIKEGAMSIPLKIYYE